MRLSYPLIGVAIATAPWLVQAAVQPDAGQSIRDLQQAPFVLQPKQSIELNLPDTPSSEVQASGPSLAVAGFRIQGNQALDSAELLAVLADLNGRTLSLGELQGAANRITQLYRLKGYPLARAYIPAQEIEQGVVQIAVLEGRYGQVQVQNASRLKSVALAPLSALKAGEAVRAQSLEQQLLLLSDLPGVQVKSTLKPGASVGATDLLVELTPGRSVSGSVDLDNYGNRFTGEYRLGATLNLNNPLGLGDRLSLRGLGSDEHQHYYRLGYQLPVGAWGTQVGVAYSDMDYRLAKDFAYLDATGTARIASAYVLQPLRRSRDFSLYAQVQFDDKRLNDAIEQFSYQDDQRSRVIVASLNGNSRDNLLGGGVNSVALSWSQGKFTIDGAQNQAVDDQSAGLQGHFYKLNATLLRLQHLTERLSLYSQIQGQWAAGNLDSSEKLSLGGIYGVRAYPQGEASGDQGYLANLELRYALTPTWQLTGFVDHGQVRLNKDTWSAGENHRSLSGAGVGARWAAQGWEVNTHAAWKLGNAKPQSDVDRSPRVWAQVVRHF